MSADWRQELHDAAQRYKERCEAYTLSTPNRWHGDHEVCLAQPDLDSFPVKVNLDEFSAVTRSPQWERLNRIGQMSHVDMVRMEAWYSRAEHSLHARFYAGTIAKRLGLSRREQKLVGLHAITHDQGHVVLSHCIEFALRDQEFDHERQGLKIAQQLRNHIGAYVSYDRFEKIFTEDSYLHQVVTAASGADRIAYLPRDLRVSNNWNDLPFTATRIDVDGLIAHVRWANDSERGPVLATDIRGIDYALDIARTRCLAYNLVYFDRNVMTLQRLSHKLLKKAGLLESELLTRIDEHELNNALRSSADEGVAQMYDKFFVCGDIPPTAYAFKLKTIGGRAYEDVEGSQQLVHALAQEPVQRDYETCALYDQEASALVNKLRDPKAIDLLEERIAHELRISPDEIVVVVPTDVHRTRPSYTPIADGNDVVDLFDLRPKQKAALEEISRQYWGLRFCVPNEHRERARQVVAPICKELFNSVEYIPSRKEMQRASRSWLKAVRRFTDSKK